MRFEASGKHSRLEALWHLFWKCFTPVEDLATHWRAVSTSQAGGRTRLLPGHQHQQNINKTQVQNTKHRFYCKWFYNQSSVHNHTSKSIVFIICHQVKILIIRDWTNPVVYQQFSIFNEWEEDWLEPNNGALLSLCWWWSIKKLLHPHGLDQVLEK